MAEAVELSLKDLAENLRRAGAEVPARMADLRHKVAREIMAAQIQEVPRKTGRLAASIRIKHEANRTMVGPEGVPYAVYIEFGTGQFNEFGGAPYEIKAKRPGGSLAFEIDGKKIFRKKVIHPGIKPRPFIRPSVFKALETMGADIARLHIKTLTGRNV